MTSITDEAEQPDWEGLREHGSLLIDERHDKLAVYVGTQGHVVIARSCGVLPADVLAIEAEHIPALVEALTQNLQTAKDREAEFWREVDEAYSEHLAKEFIGSLASGAREVTGKRTSS